MKCEIDRLCSGSRLINCEECKTLEAAKPETAPVRRGKILPVEFLGDQFVDGELVFALYYLNIEGHKTSFAVAPEEDIQLKAREAFKRMGGIEV